MQVHSFRFNTLFLVVAEFPYMMVPGAKDTTFQGYVGCRSFMPFSRDLYPAELPEITYEESCLPDHVYPALEALDRKGTLTGYTLWVGYDSLTRKRTLDEAIGLTVRIALHYESVYAK